MVGGVTEAMQILFGPVFDKIAWYFFEKQETSYS